MSIDIGNLKAPATNLVREQVESKLRIGFKRCYVCQTSKSVSEFSRNSTRFDGLQTYCKQCGKEKQSQWYYQRKHKITLEERDAFLAKQDGKCAICGNPTEFKQKSERDCNIGTDAVIDHCHTTLKIRGVLCGFCNTGLGAFKDNPFSLENAIKYLLDSVED